MSANPKSIVLILAFLSPILVSPPNAAAQTLRMNCVNPPNSIRFTSVQGSQASTEPVQFNVNIPAGQGTIFVNEKNHGICTATISDGYQFTGGSGQIDPTQVSVSDPSKPVDLIDSVSVSTKILGNQKMLYEISSSDPTIHGNLNILFIAKYKKD